MKLIFIKAIKLNSGYQAALTVGREYEAIGDIHSDDWHVIDDNKSPHYFSPLYGGIDEDGFNTAEHWSEV